MQSSVLATAIYLILSNEAMSLGNRYEAIEMILLEANFAIDLNGFTGDRIRMKAEYNDSNGEVRFKTHIHIDSKPAGEVGMPKVIITSTIRKHELSTYTKE